MKYALITSTSYPYAMGSEAGVVDGLRPHSIRKLSDRGIVPLIVSATMSSDAIDALYELASGVVFSGGADLDPKYYNQAKHEKTQNTEPGRDIVEMRLMRKILQDRKPFLGICRGMQILNVVLGGSLRQYIPDFCQEKHGAGVSEGDRIKPALNTALVEPGSRLANLVKLPAVRLTCNHKQAVDRLGKDLRASAKSSSGIVEVVEHTDPDYFCFGVQSHPEVSEFTDLDGLYEGFAEIL